MDNLWHDAVAETRENQEVIKEFTSQESEAIGERINNSLQESIDESRREEAQALEQASRAFLTF